MKGEKPFFMVRVFFLFTDGTQNKLWKETQKVRHSARKRKEEKEERNAKELYLRGTIWNASHDVGEQLVQGNN